MLSFVLFVTPGSALMYFIYRFVRANQQTAVVRIDAARSGALMEAAREASAVAQGTAQEALAQTGQALHIARTIEQVDENVRGLTEYLVARIDGDVTQRGTGRHAVPGGEDIPAITGGSGEGISS